MPENDAVPATALTVVVPEIDPPTPAVIAIETLAAVFTILPPESSMYAIGCCARSAPAAVVTFAGVPSTTWVAVPVVAVTVSYIFDIPVCVN